MSRHPLNIVILGGSFAGLSVAHSFLDNIIHELSTYEDAPSYRVVLVSPSTHLFWNICAPRAVAGPNLIDPERAFVPIEPAFSRHPFNEFTFVQGWATAVDTSARRITIETVKGNTSNRHSGNSNASTSSGGIESPYRNVSHQPASGRLKQYKLIQYHALVIATGSSHRSPLFSLHGSHEETLAEIRTFHARLQTASSIFIVGGGPSGVETAGQLALQFNRKNGIPKLFSRNSANLDYNLAPISRRTGMPFLRRNSKKKSEAVDQATAPSLPPPPSHVTPPAPIVRTPKTITLVSGGPHLLPRLDPNAGKTAEKQLKRLGVHVVHNLRQLSSTVNPDGTSNCILNNDMTITSDLLIQATGVYPNTRFLPPSMLDEAGYVVTDRETMRVLGPNSGDRIYAVGDCAAYSKNYILDVYEPIPVLMKNLHNDLLAHEYKLQTVTSIPSPAALHRVNRTGSTVDSLLTPASPGPLDSNRSSYYSRTSDDPRPASPTIPAPLTMRPRLSFPAPPRKAAILLGNPQATTSSPASAHPARRALLTSNEARLKIEALEDARFHQNPTDTQLMPITRFGGVGVVFGWRVPSFLVWVVKGRDYAVGRARRSAEKGANPFAIR